MKFIWEINLPTILITLIPIMLTLVGIIVTVTVRFTRLEAKQESMHAGIIDHGQEDDEKFKDHETRLRVGEGLDSSHDRRLALLEAKHRAAARQA